METKYGKCFITYEGKQEFPLGKVIARFDNSSVPGSLFYFLHWVMPSVDVKADEFQVGHPPHAHQSAELLFHIGTNPDDPTDLGAEIEFVMGEEREKHVVTKTTVIFIPPNVPHAPWRPLKIERPFLFLEVNQELEHSNTFRPDLLSEDERDKVDWTIWEGGQRF